MAVSCGVGGRHGSDVTLLWLWCRPAAVALIQPVAWGLPYIMGAALKKKDKRTARRKRGKNCCRHQGGKHWGRGNSQCDASEAPSPYRRGKQGAERAPGPRLGPEPSCGHWTLHLISAAWDSPHRWETGSEAGRGRILKSTTRPVLNRQNLNPG